MSKVYNKIVQSNTEPSKNDIWLKDGQMKTFGKEGWKPVGGGSSLDANTPYIFNYTGQTTVTQDEYNGLKNAIEKQRMILLYFEDAYVPVAYNLFDDTLMIAAALSSAYIMLQISSSLTVLENNITYYNNKNFDKAGVMNTLTSLERRIAALEGNTTA